MINFNSDYKIGFIGVGNMASAMIAGMTGVGQYPWENIYLFDISDDKTARFAECGAMVVGSIKELYESCNCIVLSVKPQTFPDVLAEIKACKNDKRVVYISIGAGISTDSICAALDGAPVVRALPNTPMLIGKGVSAICRNHGVTDAEFDFSCSIFESAGSVLKIDEDEMNRIICVTSSSPAYVFMFIKAICDAATAQGLDGEAALPSVCDMVSGAAELLKASDKSADELISMVCSKGGTTERAVAELKRLGFPEAIASAMQKCTDRAEELGQIK